jgi:hypothetical protein
LTDLKLESYVTINIQVGQPGIELQESLFKIKDHEKGDRLYYAYLLTKLIQTGKILVRKLPVISISIRDWLLIYEDTLVELSIKDAYDELEIIIVYTIINSRYSQADL